MKQTKFSELEPIVKIGIIGGLIYAGVITILTASVLLLIITMPWW